MVDQREDDDRHRREDGGEIGAEEEGEVDLGEACGEKGEEGEEHTPDEEGVRLVDEGGGGEEEEAAGEEGEGGGGEGGGEGEGGELEEQRAALQHVGNEQCVVDEDVSHTAHLRPGEERRHSG